METITVYKDSYDRLVQSEFDNLTEYARLRGHIIALAEIMKTNPRFVQDKLNEMAEKFQKEVDK